MSMRSDYEMTVTSENPITWDQLREFITSTPYADTPIVDEYDDADEDNDYIKIDDDGKGFSLLLREIHPEEVGLKLPAMNKTVGGIFTVDEYIHEPTEMVEAGRRTYYLKDGVEYPNFSCRDPNVPVLEFEITPPDSGTYKYEILVAGPGEHIKIASKPPEKGYTWNENSIITREWGPYGLRETENYLHDPITWGWIGRLIANRKLNVKLLTKTDQEIVLPEKQKT